MNDALDRLGVPGFRFADLFEPARLEALHEAFDGWFRAAAPEEHGRFEAYRRCRGIGMDAEAVSEVLVASAPHLSAFVAELFFLEAPRMKLQSEIHSRDPLWRFKKDFVKKRVFRADAGKGWREGPGSEEVTRGDGERPQRRSVDVDAAALATSALVAAREPSNGGQAIDEELAVARATLGLMEVDEVARKAAKAGGANWTAALRARADALRTTLRAADLTREIVDRQVPLDAGEATDAERASLVALVLEAMEAWLAQRRGDPSDAASRWPSFHQPKTLDYNHLVPLSRPEPQVSPELFVGLPGERRQRDGFHLTDRREGARAVEEEIDYCLFCHQRDKDSCSKGMRDARARGTAEPEVSTLRDAARSPPAPPPPPKVGPFKKNPLGVVLQGCPLEEKISEAHLLRRDGDPLAALAVICIDNPLCPGTGHRICNDCMKACIFQKQDPVDIPQIETRVLTEVLELPYGVEVYGLLTRWNPLDVARPFQKAYRGKNVLVVGLGPAGYTLAHHLSREGFGVVAVDGLKIEPLPARLLGGRGRPQEAGSSPLPIRDFAALHEELDERILLGFGGVSEYGITVRWDKNFLTLLYLTLARNPHLRIHGGVRFGGTLTLDDAWALGFDHVALAAGAGRPTIIDMKNNLARGIRKASDFLMALQLTGAYKKSSIANLQVRLPALVIGGGLTAIDTATELLAYYVVQIEKTAERFAKLAEARGEDELRALFDDDEWQTLSEQRGHARELSAERAAAAAEGRAPRVQALLDRWGGVTLAYRKSLADSPAYRLNHEEVEKSLEEGVRYLEHASPLEALLDPGGQVRAVRFARKAGGTVDVPARTVCVAAGTSPNVTYEKEYGGTFALDARGQFFRAHRAEIGPEGLRLVPSDDGYGAFFTSYLDPSRSRAVTFYGDNHPYYAGSVVRAMASAKDGYRYVAALFPEPEGRMAPAEADLARGRFFERVGRELTARVVRVERLTETIVEVVVHAPAAARKFRPGQFYRLQNFESSAPVIEGTRLAMEGLALTGAWVDEGAGTLGTIVLEMGGSSRLCAALRPGEEVVLMGPTGAPTEIEATGTVLLCGGGLGNAVLFSIARAFKALGVNVLYFAGYRRGEDLFKQDDIERYTDQVIWCTDGGAAIHPRRPGDLHYRGNLVQAMLSYGQGALGDLRYPLSEVTRILAIGSDGMMRAVQEARQTVLKPLLTPGHVAIGSINSPMQCMMKEVCAQCLQKQRDPVTGKETLVFSCFNQDQELDRVDFAHLRQRLRANSMQEKLTNAWLDRLLRVAPLLPRV